MRLKAVLIGMVAGAAAAFWMNGGLPRNRFELKEGRCRFKVPAAWLLTRDQAADRREGIAGVLLAGPGAGAAPRPTIAIEYYPPGNSLFASPDQLLARQSPADGPVRTATLAGRPARSWTRTADQPAVLNAGLTPTVRVRTEYRLVESGPGFHLIVFSCPEPACSAAGPAFEAVLGSFELLPPAR